jgi:hypothetical protein
MKSKSSSSNVATSTSSSISAPKLTTEKQQELVYNSAMAVATAPGKQLLMTAFMLWMSGNSLQIFSIMMLFMALSQPLQKIFTVGKGKYIYNSISTMLILFHPFIVINMD